MYLKLYIFSSRNTV